MGKNVQLGKKILIITAVGKLTAGNLAVIDHRYSSASTK